VDVRAGVGVASACFRTLHPEAAIHCFEVDPLALHLLQQNALGLGNCFVHSVGLAGQDSCRTRRLWPEDPQAEWGVEQLLPFREARAALKELGLEPIDVLRVATGGEEVEVLTSLQEQLKDIKVIYVEFTSEQDRKQIDQMLDPYPSPLAGRSCSRPKRSPLLSKQGLLCQQQFKPWRRDLRL
jgi:hypothetical protein